MTILRESNVLLVTYSLKTPLKNYGPFFEALKRQGNWWHYLPTTWLIATSNTPQDVYSVLAPLLTIKDHIFVAPIVQPCWGFLPKDAWEWINNNVPWL